jgi:DNA-binding phage protein
VTNPGKATMIAEVWRVRLMAIKTTGWSPTAHLDSDAAVLAYLEAVFEDGDPALIAAALADVAQVRSSVGAEVRD